MTSINLGVIGLGRMGRIFSRHLRHRGDGVHLAAVCSRRPEDARQFLGEGSPTKVYTDLHELLADPTIHGVVVANHTDEHKETVLAAAAAGKAIFCEKPLALTLADVDIMLAAVAQAGVLFQIGFMRRFDRGYAAAKRQIEAGVIGTPLVAQAISRDPGCPDPSWAALDRSGGLIVDMGIHDLDILRWLMNDEIVRVRTIGSGRNCPEIAKVGDIDTALMQLEFAGGALGQVEVARNCGYGYDIYAEIRGTAGTLRIGYLRDTPVLLLNRQGVHHDVVAWFEERFTPAYNAQLDHFAECIRTGVEPSAGGHDARISLQISLAALESLRTGSAVDVA